MGKNDGLMVYRLMPCIITIFFGYFVMIAWLGTPAYAKAETNILFFMLGVMAIITVVTALLPRYLKAIRSGSF